MSATRRIKADPALRTIPIIAVTSYALSGDDAKAYEAGCTGYVTKPFSPRQLLAKIREHLPSTEFKEPIVRTPARILIADDNLDNLDIFRTRLAVHRLRDSHGR